jgi:lactoylglutathione lyase
MTNPDLNTQDYKLTQTMLRIKDPKISIPFYRDVLGMTLLDQYDFKKMDFSLYFFAYKDTLVGEPPGSGPDKVAWVFSQIGTIELTHNWGTEADETFSGYHSGILASRCRMFTLPVSASMN